MTGRPARTTLQRLIVVLSTGGSVEVRTATVPPRVPIQADHQTYEVTVPPGASEREVTAVLLHQLVQLDHGPGREQQALAETVRLLPDETPEALAQYLHLPLEEIAALSSGR